MPPCDSLRKAVLSTVAFCLQPSTAVRGSRGFSLIEVLVVVAVLGVLGGIVIPISNGFITRQRADAASVAALSTIQAARNRAIAERRNVQLTFTTPNRIVATRIEVPGPATTVVDNVMLENQQTFLKFAGVPDTPDGFGAASAIQFSGTAPFMFTSDGSLIDSNGDVSNGTLFFGRGSDKETARAITIFGVTGLIRSWKWGGGQWNQ